MSAISPVATALPRHVGVVMDGNRRWARQRGLIASQGHKIGADHLGDLLDWLAERGIGHASVFVLSADNIRKRNSAEVGFLFRLISTVVPQKVRESGSWQLHVSGDLSLLPESAQQALTQAMEDTAGREGHLTLAIGYDAREDVVAGVRNALRRGLDLDDASAFISQITAGLPGGPVKDIDLVIRTSGEQRMSGFFPWQCEHAEIYFSPRLWPDFSEEDLDAALAHYASKNPSS